MSLVHKFAATVNKNKVCGPDGIGVCQQKNLTFTHILAFLDSYCMAAYLTPC